MEDNLGLPVFVTNAFGLPYSAPGYKYVAYGHDGKLTMTAVGWDRP